MQCTSKSFECSEIFYLSDFYNCNNNYIFIPEKLKHLKVMKKILIPFCFMLFSIIVTAQKNILNPLIKSSPIKNEELGTFTKGTTSNEKGMVSSKVIGDTILYDDFSNPAHWIIQNLGGGAKTWVIGTITDPDAAQLQSQSLNFNLWNPDPSSINKFAYFDAVYYLLPPPSVPPFISVILEYNGTLNLSAHPGVGIQWNQNFRTYNYDKVYFEYSIDDGATWTSTGGSELYPALGIYYYAPVSEYINLSNQIGNYSSVKIRFRWECNYTGSNPNAYGAGYGWMIDNVLLLGLSNNDLLVEKVFPRFYGLGFYSKTPDRQRMKLSSVKSLVLNNGGTTQSDIYTDADIRIQGSPVSDFTSMSSIPYSSLYIGYRDTLATDTFTYIPQSGINTHIINCTATQAESEDYLADNRDSITFAITDTVFARDQYYNGRFGPTMVAGTNDGDYSAVGYYFTKQDTAHSISVYIAAGSTAGSQIAGVISYYESGNIFSEQILTNTYTILQTDINNWVTLSFKPYFDGFSEVLNSNKLYYAGVKYYWKTMVPAKRIYIGTDPYAPLIIDDWGSGVNYFIKELTGTSYGHLLEMPKIRLNVSYPHYLTTAPTISHRNNFTIMSPNPSTGIVYINNKNVSMISVFNMIGACVFHCEMASEKLDLSSLPQGSYVVKFYEGEFLVTKKLNIIR